MKHNTDAVAQLQPGYMGFIFFEKSPRNYTAGPPLLPASVKRVGVFVNADPARVLQITSDHGLDVIQLHGDESPHYCRDLKEKVCAEAGKEVTLWKVFSVDQEFDFDQLAAYRKVVDRFLFDTAGPLRGGSGKTFNWELLHKYPYKEGFILSGGIGPDELPAIKALIKKGIPVFAVDVNSRFEIEAGFKDLEKLKEFNYELQR